MKKHLFTLLLFCLSISVHAQSISFFDLTNLTNLSGGQAHTYLTLGGRFKHDYVQEKDGNKIEHFKTVGAQVKEQTVTIGNNTKLPDGTVLHNISYTTTDVQHIVNFISQAKRSRLIMKFQGIDSQNNIYVFDNEFYHVSMFISTTESKGAVEIKQKEFAGYQ